MGTVAGERSEQDDSPRIPGHFYEVTKKNKFIVEFESNREWVFGTGECSGYMVARSKRAIDLRWVASAAPDAGHNDWTLITMCGSSDLHAFYIKIRYDDFMAMWMKART